MVVRTIFAAALSAVVVSGNHAEHVSGSVLFNAKTHVPTRSAGCGKISPYSLGKTSIATGTYAGATWTYRVYVPSTYDYNTAVPLILQHPGWGMTAQAEEKGAGITPYAEQYGFISVTPQGGDDNSHQGGPWYSWNAVGTTQSPGPAGPTCTNKANYPSYCYTSCGKCTGSPQCSWTTCHETVTPTGTGTENVGGFIPGLYDTLESQLCIDTTREYAAGESNGGMMTYQLGVDLAARLAAIAPQFGSFHRGFNLAPLLGVPVMDTHGMSDTTVPANVSLAGDGYYYTPVAEIFGGNAYSKGWKAANGCTGPSTHYPTSYDGVSQLWCASEGVCTGGDVVRCSYKGGHNWFNGGGTDNGGLVTEFLLKWTKTSHIGRGYSEGQALGPAQLLHNITIVDDVVGAASTLHMQDFMQAMAPTVRSHYGDPDKGCLPDEDIILVGTGRVCALKIGVALDQATVPTPLCKIGGVTPSANGCPTDASVGSGSKAWPVCLGKGNGTDPYSQGDFHCMLVCPCAGVDAECGPDADAHCPSGAKCERGELRNRAQGVCTYHGHEHTYAIVV